MNLRPLAPERPIRQFHQSHRRACRRKRLILLYSAARQDRIRTPKSHRSGRRPLQAEREWFTPAKVATNLQVSRATVYALIARGELPATRVGLSLRVHAGPLAAFLSR